MAANFLMDFGTAVRRLRERHSMTQSRLAEQVGLGRTSMTNLERGKQNPPLSILPRLAEALGVSVIELVAEATRSTTPDGEDMLADHVQDNELRRWANKVIQVHVQPNSTASRRPQSQEHR